MRPPGSALVIVLLVGLLVCPAEAGLFLRLEVPELVARADAVVIARVLDVRSAWNDGHTMIHTFTTLVVTEALRSAGHRPGDTVVVRTAGGRVGRVRMTAGGAPVFQVNTTVVVFLSTWSDGALGVLGYRQGLSRIDMGSDGRAIPAGGRGEGMGLDELRRLTRILPEASAR